MSHLAEPLRQVTELARGVRRHPNVVVAGGDIVRGPRQLQDRAHDPAREVPGEQPGHGEPEQPGEREPLDQRADASTDVGLRLRDDDRTHGRRANDQRVCDRDVAAIRARRFELEGKRLAGRPVDRLHRQAGKPEIRLLSRKRPVRPDPVELGTGGEPQVGRRERRSLPISGSVPVALFDRVRVQRGDAVRLATELRDRLIAGELLKQRHRNRGRDHAGQHDAGEKDERQLDSQRPQRPEHRSRFSSSPCVRPSRATPCNRRPRR